MTIATAKDSVRDDAPKIVQDATCTFCGCVCDDIDLTVQGDEIVAAKRACALGKTWLLGRHVDDRPDCLISGRPATLEAGIERAAQILVAAKYPLVYGLSGTTCESQRVAVSIADWIGGTVDTPTSIYHGPTGMAFRGVGEVTASLGEIANRGDLIIYWGANPAETDPRHLSKYSLLPQGMFLPNGRADRTCVLIDVRKTKSAKSADFFLQIKPGHDFEALWMLRALAHGLELNAGEVEDETGVPLAAWQDLMARMKGAKFGVLFFGRGLTMSPGKHLNTEALLALVRDMNAYTRFVARPMRAAGNVTGADDVITWRTGFPFGVNLSHGYPRYNPGEFTADDMLARGEVDAALIIAHDPAADFSQAARDRLAAIPRISVDWSDTPLARGATVAFASAKYGIHGSGTVYRMDDVPIPLRPALDSSHPTDLEILRRLEARVCELLAASAR